VGLRCCQKEILLQTSRQVVGIRKEETLRKVHDLIQTLITKLRNLTIGETKTDATLSPIPHRKEH